MATKDNRLSRAQFFTYAQQIAFVCEPGSLALAVVTKYDETQHTLMVQYPIHAAENKPVDLGSILTESQTHQLQVMATSNSPTAIAIVEAKEGTASDMDLKQARLTVHELTQGTQTPVLHVNFANVRVYDWEAYKDTAAVVFLD